MKTIEISDKKFKFLKTLCEEYDEIYGTDETVWNFDDADTLREIGGEAINIFRKYLEK